MIKEPFQTDSSKEMVSTTKQETLLRLQCGCNNYDWGKKGKSSAAARFAAATPYDGFSIQEDKPYAELWMGTHPSLPSKELITGRTLLDLVSNNQALLGRAVSQKYGNRLPFLFKVLSIDKALSIQAHPDKILAKRLHAKDPRNYPDDNHKPEMALAITEFEGLCGFRPLEEIAYFLTTIPPFRSLVGEAEAQRLEKVAADPTSPCDAKPALRAAFSKLMRSDRPAVSHNSAELLTLVEGGKISPGPSTNTSEELCELVKRCSSQFPEDIGLFVLFFLNYVKLRSGEAMYLKADDIHAYISGDIVECMASSDNVIRAGFTPKFQDITTLTQILTYDHDPPDQQLLIPTVYPYATLNNKARASGSETLLYDPPIEEFSVIRTVLKGENAKVTFRGIAGPSIIICTGGRGRIIVGLKCEEIQEGWVYFVAATAELMLENAAEEMVTFRAFCEFDRA